MNQTSFHHRRRHGRRLIVQLVRPILQGNPRRKQSEISPKSSIDPPDPFTIRFIACALLNSIVCFQRWRIELGHTWRTSEREQRSLILLNKTKNSRCIYQRSVCWACFRFCCPGVMANNCYSTSDAKCFNFSHGNFPQKRENWARLVPRSTSRALEQKYNMEWTLGIRDSRKTFWNFILGLVEQLTKKKLNKNNSSSNKRLFQAHGSWRWVKKEHALFFARPNNREPG